MKIYTKTGDKGKTSLFDGTRVYKNNSRVEAYGTVDELNSVIGIVIAQLRVTNYELRVKETLIAIQNNLFEIGACLANPTAPENPTLNKHLEEHTKQLELYIDAMTVEMPELTHFILPGGGTAGAYLQMARTVSRRAERQVVALNQLFPVAREILIYLNRLSDLFHTMSRYVNFKENIQEIIWQSRIR